MDNNNQNPQVYYTPQPASKPKEIWLKPRFLLYILAVVVILEIAWGLKTLLSPVAVKKAVKIAPQSAYANISLSALKQDIKAGDVFLVDINLQTAGHKTVATDVILKYDPLFLEASKSGFIKGMVYPEYPLVGIDNTEGAINASGIITQQGGSFAGNGVFGKVWFKAKLAGKTAIQVEFMKNSYTGSDMIEIGSPKNILDQVSNLELDIK